MEVQQEETITILPTPSPSTDIPDGNSPAKTQNSQKRLRLYATLSMELFDRHRGLNPAHDIFEDILGESAKAFVTAYDTAATEVYSGSEMKDRLAPAIKKVRHLVWNWKPFLNLMEVPTLPQGSSRLHNGFELANYASTLLGYLTPERIDASPMTAEQVNVFINAMNPALAQLKELASEHMEHHVERRDELVLVRTEALHFERVLVAYRQTLRQLVGSRHPDVKAITHRRKRGVEVDAETTPEGEVPIESGNEVEETRQLEEVANADTREEDAA